MRRRRGDKRHCQMLGLLKSGGHKNLPPGFGITVTFAFFRAHGTQEDALSLYPSAAIVPKRQPNMWALAVCATP